MTLKFNFHVLKFWCLFHSLFTIAVRNSVKALSLRFIIILSTDFTDDWSKSGVVTLWLLLEGLYATKRLPHWSCLLRRDSTDSTEGSRPQLTNWKLLVVETAIDRKREKEGGEREREREREKGASLQASNCLPGGKESLPSLNSSRFTFSFFPVLYSSKEIFRRRAENECNLFSWIFSRILWPNCLDLRAQNNWLAPVKPLRLHDSRADLGTMLNSKSRIAASLRMKFRDYFVEKWTNMGWKRRNSFPFSISNFSSHCSILIPIRIFWTYRDSSFYISSCKINLNQWTLQYTGVNY